MMDVYTVDHYAYMTKMIQEFGPTCFKKALGKINRDAIMNEEMVALDANHNWELVPLPHDKKAIGCKWVQKIKHNANGSISSYKPRLVANKYVQTYSIDYEETFSPIVRMAPVRIVIAVVALRGVEISSSTPNVYPRLLSFMSSSFVRYTYGIVRQLCIFGLGSHMNYKIQGYTYSVSLIVFIVMC